MSGAGDRAPRADEVCDNRRVPCAVGLIRVAERAASLPDGTVLAVLSRDRFAPMELSLWAERDGHPLLAVERVGRWPRRAHRVTVRITGRGAARGAVSPVAASRPEQHEEAVAPPTPGATP